LNLNHQNNEGENALHSLCINESKNGDLASVARFLIDKGIGVQSKVKNGKDSALHILCSNENCSVELLRVLIEKGIDLTARNIEGDNALHLVCRHHPEKENLLPLVRFLINAGIDAQSRTPSGSSAIYILWENEDEIANVFDIMQLLIDG
jgi:ankyrin repeat protein